MVSLFIDFWVPATQESILSVLVAPVFCFGEANGKSLFAQPAQEGETDPWGREVTTDCRPPSNMFLKAIQENLEMHGNARNSRGTSPSKTPGFHVVQCFFLLAGFFLNSEPELFICFSVRWVQMLIVTYNSFKSWIKHACALFARPLVLC